MFEETYTSQNGIEPDGTHSLRACIDASAEGSGPSDHREYCHDCIKRQSATTDRVLRRERDALQREVRTLRRMVRSVKVFEGEVSGFDWWVTRATVRGLPCWQAVILRKGNQARSKRAVFVHEYGSAEKAIAAIYVWFISQHGFAETFQCQEIAETIEAMRSIRVLGEDRDG